MYKHGNLAWGLAAVALVAHVTAILTPISEVRRDQSPAQDPTVVEARRVKTAPSITLLSKEVQLDSIDEERVLEWFSYVTGLTQKLGAWPNWIRTKLVYYLKYIIGHNALATKNLLEAKSLDDAALSQKTTSAHAKSEGSAETKIKFDEQKQPHFIQKLLKWVGKKLVYLLKRLIGYQSPAKASKKQSGVEAAGTKLESDVQEQKHLTIGAADAHVSTIPAKLSELKLNEEDDQLYRKLIKCKTATDMLWSLRLQYLYARFFSSDPFHFMPAYIKACEDTASRRGEDKYGVETAFYFLKNFGRLGAFVKSLLKMEAGNNITQKAAAQRIRLGLNELALKQKWTKEKVKALCGRDFYIETVT